MAGVVPGKVAVFTSLADTDDQRDRSSDVQHIAAILPFVLANYAISETQRTPRVESNPSRIEPSHCVLA
jgi:hypothetical protein